MATQRSHRAIRRKALLSGVLFIGLLSMSNTLIAQQQGKNKLVDRRDQAEGWYVPVWGEVLVEGKRTSDYTMELFRDNKSMGQMKPQKKGRFLLELDIDAMYTVLVSKPGYQTKMIYVDTKLPQDLVRYPDYELYMNMLPYDAKNIDPFYTDFPSAIVRWNEETGGFYHSEHYLTHIQTKLAGYASATF